MGVAPRPTVLANTNLVRNTDNVITIAIIDEDGDAIALNLFTKILVYLYTKPKNILQEWQGGDLHETDVNEFEIYLNRSNSQNAISGKLFIEVVAFSEDERFEGGVFRQVSTGNSLATLIDSPTARVITP